MTWNKLFVTIVAATLMGVALPTASAYHIDHHSGPSGTAVTWVAGTGAIDVCEADRSNATGQPLMGEGGLCFAHNHTAADNTAGSPTETTTFGHHTGSGHAADGHADHGVYDDPITATGEEPGQTAQDNDTVLDGGFDIPISVTSSGCAQIGNDDWTALNVTIGTGTHQTTTFLPDFWSGQISGVDSAATNATEHLVYHEETACLASDGHIAFFIDALSIAIGGDAQGSYTTWGGQNPCPPGERVCATTGGAGPT